MSDLYIAPHNFLKKDAVFAVVQASNDMTKKGFEVYAKMKQQGYNVFPLHPVEHSIQGDPCYPNLEQLRPFADVVILTTSWQENEHIGMDTLQQMRDLNIFKIWIEPHCDTVEMRSFAQMHTLDIMTGKSILEVLGWQQ